MVRECYKLFAPENMQENRHLQKDQTAGMFVTCSMDKKQPSSLSLRRTTRLEAGEPSLL